MFGVKECDVKTNNFINANLSNVSATHKIQVRRDRVETDALTLKNQVRRSQVFELNSAVYQSAWRYVRLCSNTTDNVLTFSNHAS